MLRGNNRNLHCTPGSPPNPLAQPTYLQDLLSRPPPVTPTPISLYLPLTVIRPPQPALAPAQSGSLAPGEDGEYRPPGMLGQLDHDQDVDPDYNDDLAGTTSPSPRTQYRASQRSTARHAAAADDPDYSDYTPGGDTSSARRARSRRRPRRVPGGGDDDDSGMGGYGMYGRGIDVPGRPDSPDAMAAAAAAMTQLAGMNPAGQAASGPSGMLPGLPALTSLPGLPGGLPPPELLAAAGGGGPGSSSLAAMLTSPAAMALLQARQAAATAGANGTPVSGLDAAPGAGPGAGADQLLLLRNRLQQLQGQPAAVQQQLALAAIAQNLLLARAANAQQAAITAQQLLAHQQQQQAVGLDVNGQEHGEAEGRNGQLALEGGGGDGHADGRPGKRRRSAGAVLKREPGERSEREDGVGSGAGGERFERRRGRSPRGRREDDDVEQQHELEQEQPESARFSWVRQRRVLPEAGVRTPVARRGGGGRGTGWPTSTGGAEELLAAGERLPSPSPDEEEAAAALASAAELVVLEAQRSVQPSGSGGTRGGVQLAEEEEAQGAEAGGEQRKPDRLRANEGLEGDSEGGAAARGAEGAKGKGGIAGEQEETPAAAGASEKAIGRASGSGVAEAGGAGAEEQGSAEAGAAEAEAGAGEGQGEASVLQAGSAPLLRLLPLIKMLEPLPREQLQQLNHEQLVERVLLLQAQVGVFREQMRTLLQQQQQLARGMDGQQTMGTEGLVALAEQASSDGLPLPLGGPPPLAPMPRLLPPGSAQLPALQQLQQMQQQLQALAEGRSLPPVSVGPRGAALWQGLAGDDEAGSSARRGVDESGLWGVTGGLLTGVKQEGPEAAASATAAKAAGRQRLGLGLPPAAKGPAGEVAATPAAAAAAAAEAVGLLPPSGAGENAGGLGALLSGLGSGGALLGGRSTATATTTAATTTSSGPEPRVPAAQPSGLHCPLPMPGVGLGLGLGLGPAGQVLPGTILRTLAAAAAGRAHGSP